MALGFTYELELEDGTSADPPTLKSAAVPNWRPGDTIPLGARTLRVLAVRADVADQPSALVVEADRTTCRHGFPARERRNWASSVDRRGTRLAEALGAPTRRGRF
jgi:hypothetical protein